MSTIKKPRVTRSDVIPGTFAALMHETMTRLSLDETRAAAYLGVPVFTFRKWASGERTPNASALRLIEVLGMVEALAPALHTSFIPPVAAAPKRGRGRPKKPHSQSSHVEKSGLVESTDTDKSAT